MSTRVRLLMLSAFAIVTGGCGGDSTGPSNANVAGAWTLSASNMSGGGVSCNLGNSPMTLSQSGTTFTGSYGPGTVTCSAGIQSFNVSVHGTVVSGIVNLNAVQFDLDTGDFHHSGSVNGNSMSGTASWTFDLGGDIGVVVLNGNWSAAKQ
jgi:hypothetical protein